MSDAHIVEAERYLGQSKVLIDQAKAGRRIDQRAAAAAQALASAAITEALLAVAAEVRALRNRMP